MIYKHIAWVNALRFQLREQENWEERRSFISEEDFEKLLHKANQSNYLLQMYLF